MNWPDRAAIAERRARTTPRVTAHPAEECGDPSSCPGHAALWHTYMAGGQPHDWCDECKDGVAIVESHDWWGETAERHVIRLACGHKITWPIR